MKRTLLLLCAMFFVTAGFIPSALTAQDQKKKEQPVIKWVKGPTKADMEGVASVKVPKGYLFADGDNTRKILEYYGNISSNTEVGYLSPDSGDWFVVFSFRKVGYIKDDEGSSLDANAILSSLRKSNEEANKIKREKGMPEMEIKGWYKRPAYDKKTNNLEWATLLRSGKADVVNYNIRYLGRKGVMEVIVVADPKNLKPVIEKSKKLLTGYAFNSGNKYSEFAEGDKVAEYGLKALMTGGALAVAAKTGLLQKFWKLILIVVLGIGAFFKKIFGRKEKPGTVEAQENQPEKEEN